MKNISYHARVGGIKSKLNCAKTKARRIKKANRTLVPLWTWWKQTLLRRNFKTALSKNVTEATICRVDYDLISINAAPYISWKTDRTWIRTPPKAENSIKLWIWWWQAVQTIFWFTLFFRLATRPISFWEEKNHSWPMRQCWCYTFCCCVFFSLRLADAQCVLLCAKRWLYSVMVSRLLWTQFFARWRTKE